MCRPLRAKRPKLHYLLYGELAPYEDEIDDILWQQYGVRLDRVADCDVNESVGRRCDRYNRTVSDHFGFTGARDIFLSKVDDLTQRDEQ